MVTVLAFNLVGSLPKENSPMNLLGLASYFEIDRVNIPGFRDLICCNSLA